MSRWAAQTAWTRQSADLARRVLTRPAERHHPLPAAAELAAAHRLS